MRASLLTAIGLVMGVLGAAPRAAADSSLRFDGNLAGFFTTSGENLAGTGFSYIQPTDRESTNYLGFQYTYVREEESAGPLRLAAVDFNPHLAFDFHARDIHPVIFRSSILSGDWTPVFRPTPYSDPLAIDFNYGTNRIATDNNENLLRMKLVFYDAWIRLEPTALERTSIRIGHFDIPYGSNPLLNPRPGDFIMPIENMDVWMKKDWGVIWKAPLRAFDYEVALTTGMGLGIRNPRWFDDRYPGTFALSGRVGTPSYAKFGYGLSTFYGRTAIMQGSNLIHPYAPWRWRANLDAFYRPRFQTAFAASVGGGQNERHPDERIVVSDPGDVVNTLTTQFFASYAPQGLRWLELTGQFKALIYDWSRSTNTFLSTTGQAAISIADAVMLRLAVEWIFDSPRVIGPEDVRFYFGLNYYR